MYDSDAQSPPQWPLRRSARAAALGATMGLVGGATALCLDAVLTLLVARTPLGVLGLSEHVLGVYLALGVLAGLLVTLVFSLSSRAGHRRLGGLQLFAWALLLPYLIPVWERLDAVVGGLWAAVLTVSGTGLWLLALRRMSGRRCWTEAALIAAPTLSLLLGVHRTLLPEPLAPSSLLFTAAMVVVALALASALRLATRCQTPTATLATGAAVVAAALLVVAIVVRTVGGFSGGIQSDRSGGPESVGSDHAPTPLAQTNRPPHLLLLTIDTLRLDVFDDVASNTPEGQAFLEAMRGATFYGQARAPAPWTAPSVATLMTGLLPDEHLYGKRTGDRDRPLAGLPDGIPTLAEGLRAAGYRCEAYVANPLLYPGSGIDRGFHVFQSLEDSSWKMPWVRIPFTLRATRPIIRRWIPQMPYLPGERVADIVLRRLPEPPEARSRPYFLWVHLMDPHYPYLRHAWTEQPKTHLGRYRGEVRYALQQTSRIIEAMRDAGLWEDSVVVFTSDHGEMFPRDRHEEVWPQQDQEQRKNQQKNNEQKNNEQRDKKKRLGHGHSLHAELMRVPLALRMPAGNPTLLGTRALTSGPLSLAELPRFVERALGVSLGLRSSDANRPLTLSGTEWGPKQRGLVHGNWKLIHFPNGEWDDRLFHHGRDPTERRNLAQRRPDIADKLRKRLVDAWANMRPHETGDAGELDEETLQRLKALGYLED